MKILVTGGARSGKSRHAQARAEALHPRRYYLATAQALDPEMAVRIAHHRADRDSSWQTLEEPLQPAPLLRQDGVVLLDCLTLWLSNLLVAGRSEVEVDAAIAELVDAVAAVDNPLVLVTNEVGLGIVPDNGLARAFRDHSGRLSQRLAAVCDEVVLCVAGLPLSIKAPSFPQA